MRNHAHLPSPLTGLETPQLLNSLADGAYITDADRRILFWNRAAEQITGWTADEVVGRTCYDNILQHVDQEGRVLCGKDSCPLHRSIVTGRKSTLPCLVFARNKSGTRTPVEVSVGPLRSAGGQVIGGIETFRDATEKLQDLLRARAIQEQALHSPPPDDPRVSIHVCRQSPDLVGGDFHHIERLDEDHHLLLLADVMGHGIAAALYTMTLGSLLEEHTHLKDSPAAFLHLLNQHLHALIHEAGYFATGVIALFDSSNGILRCARAGHPEALLFRADGRTERVGGKGPALGMFPSGTWQESEVTMQPGDTLLLYSDGATELFDPQDHELGLEGLEKLVSGQLRNSSDGEFSLENLVDQLLNFSNQIHLTDDLTLLKLRRQR